MSQDQPQAPRPRTRRDRTTRLGVRISEHVSKALITVGGIGTIAAVTLIFVFLASVVLPLFLGAETSAPQVLAGVADKRPLRLAIDEYRLLGAKLDADGELVIYRLDTGKVLERSRPLEQSISASSFSPGGDSVALGFEDGTIRFGTYGFEPSFPQEGNLPAELLNLAQGDVAEFEGGIVQRTPEGKLRHQRFVLSLSDPMETPRGEPIRRLSHVSDDGSAVFCALVGDRLAYLELVEKPNFFTGEPTLTLEAYEIDFEARGQKTPPDYVEVAGLGDNIFLAWQDGTLLRIDARDPEEAEVVERISLVPEEDAQLTALGSLIGSSTLITGDDKGRLRAWFRIKPETAQTPDGQELVLGHELSVGGAPVQELAASQRSRMILAGRADGSCQLYQVTTNQEVTSVRTKTGAAPLAVQLAPKEDGIAVLTEEHLELWELDPAHPEASVAAFFLPVWYEGYPEPEHVWQSESGTDEFEPKLGFLPIVYGTLKATFYSMLFGMPLALLAAIFTSEFLDRRLRVPIKSIIEMMASLPSVVLGFLAAIVIAPAAQAIIPATMAVFITLPLALLIGAYLWQLLPQALTLRFAGWQRLACIALALPIGILGALALGPLLEHTFFAGNMELWLDGQTGGAIGGWMILMLPASAAVVILVGGRWLASWTRKRTAGWSRKGCALFDFVRFGIGAVAVFVLAFLASWGLDAASFDPRGSYVDTYVQRNALVVGFVMGFAVIPIIYTLAEDALSSVPEHLRLASLGAGATQWQTTMRVIIPTAMSGLFSAVMVGLGRAVGETMIVLMAAGNTPVMDSNIFNGFRTLSANIAVELPEAVRDSTHYRTLFLAALVLFAMTFLVNTVAEIVRLRFRRRSYQL